MLRVSVIVPIYNAEEYLERCVDSILNQTVKELECILIDDGSTDNSAGICDQYAEKDSRVKVVHKVNSGQSDSCNIGIDISSGEYIAFVDSDDYLNESMYEKLISLAESENTDIAMCTFERVYSSEFENNDVASNTTKLLSKNDIFNMWHTVEANVKWNKVFKRSIFDDIRLPSGKSIDDEPIKPFVFAKADKVAYTDEKLYYYRQRQNSIMRSDFNLKKMHKLDAIYVNIKWFDENSEEEMKQKEEKYYCDYFFDYYKQAYKIYTEGEKCAKQYLKAYKKQFQKLYKNFLNNKEFSLKYKLILTFCNICPELLFSILNRKDKNSEK